MPGGRAIENVKFLFLARLEINLSKVSMLERLTLALDAKVGWHGTIECGELGWEP